MFTALGRGFNPVADLSLIKAGLRLATGAIGPVLTLGAGLAALVAGGLRGLGALVGERCLGADRGAADAGARHGGGIGPFRRGSPRPRSGMPWADGTCPLSPPGAAFTARIGAGAHRDERAPRSPICAPSRRPPPTIPYAARETLLRGIGPGRSDRFRGKLRPDEPRHTALCRNPPHHADRGRGATWCAGSRDALGAPERADARRSKLAQPPATFANGLWIADQTSYAAALASNRRGLLHIAPRYQTHGGFPNRRGNAGRSRFVLALKFRAKWGSRRCWPRLTSAMPGCPSTG